MATPPARRIRRIVGRIYHALGPLEDACRAVGRAAALVTRVVLVRLGIARRELLVMNCGENGEIDGFYAQFTVILGLLEHFERWPHAIAGARVDFGERGLYYEPARGPNSWEYYFEPIDLDRGCGAIERKMDIRQQYRFAVRGEHMPRERAHALIARHIHVRPHILKKVDDFVNARFEGFQVVGVHYRGTDKWTEAPRVPYEDVGAAVREALGTAGTDRSRVFVASDEQAFVAHMEGQFPGRVVSWETRRSSDGSPIDYRMEDNYKKGEDAVIDCLLLSRCQRLVRTSSSLSLCSTYFNAAMPAVLLNRRH